MDEHPAVAVLAVDVARQQPLTARVPARSSGITLQLPLGGLEGCLVDNGRRGSDDIDPQHLSLAKVGPVAEHPSHGSVAPWLALAGEVAFFVETAFKAPQAHSFYRHPPEHPPDDVGLSRVDLALARVAVPTAVLRHVTVPVQPSARPLRKKTPSGYSFGAQAETLGAPEVLHLGRPPTDEGQELPLETEIRRFVHEEQRRSASVALLS